MTIEIKYTEANGLEWYLWDNGELKRDQVRESGERVGKHYAHPGYIEHYHDPRDVQILADQIADKWIKEVPDGSNDSNWNIKDPKKRANLIKQWGKKRKEARQIYIAAFIPSYNKWVKQYEVWQEEERRERVRKQAEEEARRQWKPTPPPQPVYTPPPQPVQQPAPQPKPVQQPQPQPQYHKPAPPPNVAKKDGATITLKRVDHSNPDECVYVLEVKDPKYMDRPYEQEWVVPLVEDTISPTTSSYGSSGTNERGQAGAGSYAEAGGYEIPRPSSTSGTPQRPKRPQGGYFRKP